MSSRYTRYTLLFLLVPYACVLISSTLYYVWRQEHPRKAQQINRLGLIVFGAQFLLMFGYGILVAALGGGQ
ncbi:MAG: hypothetical protein IT445_18310 [Phycisphaeraceae bacterium]|nr:hypothetical protein [Phycisphaeraceae bacterium]